MYNFKPDFKHIDTGSRVAHLQLRVKIPHEFYRYRVNLEMMGGSSDVHHERARSHYRLKLLVSQAASTIGGTIPIRSILQLVFRVSTVRSDLARGPTDNV